MTTQEVVMRSVARQLLRGLRESLTIAGQVGHPIEDINAALHQLQTACDDCLVLTRPYVGESRVVVTVTSWEALKRAAGSMEERLSNQEMDHWGRLCRIRGERQRGRPHGMSHADRGDAV